MVTVTDIRQVTGNRNKIIFIYVTSLVNLLLVMEKLLNYAGIQEDTHFIEWPLFQSHVRPGALKHVHTLPCLIVWGYQLGGARTFTNS